jgi:hypothetical protein
MLSESTGRLDRYPLAYCPICSTVRLVEVVQSEATADIICGTCRYIVLTLFAKPSRRRGDVTYVVAWRGKPLGQGPTPENGDG